jgi:hypothetical protein
MEGGWDFIATPSMRSSFFPFSLDPAHLLTYFEKQKEV